MKFSSHSFPSLWIALFLALAPVSKAQEIVGPETFSDGEHVKASEQGISTSGGVRVEQDAIVRFVTDQDAILELNDGFVAEPGVGGSFVADIVSTEDLALIIAGLNQPPIADSQAIQILEDNPVNIVLTGSDPDGDDLSFRVSSSPSEGAITGVVPDITYTPAPNGSGTVLFDFIVNDGALDSEPATIAITVLPVDDAPIAPSVEVVANENGIADIAFPEFDADGDPLSVNVTQGPRKGTLTMGENGYEYTPESGMFGLELIEYKLTDGTSVSESGFILIDIAPVNENPSLVQVVASAGDTLTSEGLGSNFAFKDIAYSNTYDEWSLAWQGGDVGGSEDSFHFAYADLAGTAEATVRVDYVSGESVTANAGLMFRSSSAADSPFVSIAYSASDELILKSRSTEGAEVVSTAIDWLPLPEYVRLVNTGDAVRAFVSEEGIRWRLLDHIEVTLGQNYLYGLYCEGGASDELVVCEFGELAYTLIDLDPFQDAYLVDEIGPLVTYSDLLESDQDGSYAFESLGGSLESGVGNSSFASVSLDQDFELVCRLLDVGEGSSSSQAGLMVRSGQGDSSAFSSIQQDLAGNLSASTRISDAASIQVYAIGSEASPTYLRLLRTGSSVTSYHSPDGAIWTEAETFLVQADAALNVGVFAAGASASLPVEVLFDSVSLRRVIFDKHLDDLHLLAGQELDLVLTESLFENEEIEGLDISLDSGPEWLSFDPINLRLYGVPNAGQEGEYSIGLVATNELGLSSAPLMFKITVWGDDIPPSAPLSLSATDITPSSVRLSWNESTDNVGVERYEVRRDGELVRTTVGTGFTDSGLSPETNYGYEVSAVDASGNTSDVAGIAIETLGVTAESVFINVGGPEYVDLVGNVWEADFGYSGGLLRSTTSSISGTEDDALYQTSRYGASFAYNIDLPNGDYSVRLHFAEIDPNAPGFFPGFFNVSLEDGVATGAYDIYTTVGKYAAFVAEIEIAVEDSQLNIAFSGPFDSAKINAIEIVGTVDLESPTAPSGAVAQSVTSESAYLSWAASSDNVGVAFYEISRDGILVAAVSSIAFSDLELDPSNSYLYEIVAVDGSGNKSETAVLEINTTANLRAANSLIRINSGGGNYLDTAGSSWSADYGFNSGTSIVTSNEISGVEDDVLYQTGRFGSDLSYTIEVPRGDYLVRMHFSEIDENAQSPESRRFDVNIEDQVILSDIDIYSQVGGYAQLLIDSELTVLDGALDIEFDQSKLDATVNAVEVYELLVPDSELPSDPSRLFVSNVTNSSLLLTWTASTDNRRVDGYVIKRNGDVVATVLGTTFEDTGLTSSESYAYEVYAFDPASNISGSAFVEATTSKDTDLTSPSMPTDLSVSSASGYTISLSWNPSTDDAGVYYYEILRDGEVIENTDSLDFVDVDLEPQTSYLYSVVAYDEAGNASTPALLEAVTGVSSDTTPPSSPTSLNADQLASSSLRLSWDSSLDDVQVAFYEITRDGEAIGKVTGTSAFDSFLSPQTDYTYQVVAYDSSGNASNPATLSVTTPVGSDNVVPTAPGSIRPVLTLTDALEMVWDPAVDDTGVERYELFRDGFFVASTSYSAFSDTLLAPSTTYFYEVYAFDQAGNRSLPSSVYLRTLGEQLVGNNIERLNVGGSAYVDSNGYQWGSDEAVPDGESIQTQEIVLGTDDSPLYQNARVALSFAYSFPVSNGSYIVKFHFAEIDPSVVGTGMRRFDVLAENEVLFDNLDVYYEVESGYAIVLDVEVTVEDGALDLEFGGEVGNALVSAIEVFETVEQDYTKPTVPGNLQALSVAYNEVALSWDASIDDIGVASYEVYRNGLLLGSTVELVFVDATAMSMTTLNYEVRAVDLSGNRSEAARVEVLTPEAPDSDGDGMNDEFELVYGLDPNNPSDASGDLDGDSVSNLDEYIAGSNPSEPDSDFDGMPDDWELSHGLALLEDDAAVDLDGDGIPNTQEFSEGTSPTDYYNGSQPVVVSLNDYMSELDGEKILAVLVQDDDGNPLTNAPVKFYPVVGDHLVAASPEELGQESVVVRSDSSGIAIVYLKSSNK